MRPGSADMGSLAYRIRNRTTHLTSVTPLVTSRPCGSNFRAAVSLRLVNDWRAMPGRMARLIGLLFSGYAVKAYAIGAAVIVASEAWSVLSVAAAGISKGLGQ